MAEWAKYVSSCNKGKEFIKRNAIHHSSITFLFLAKWLTSGFIAWGVATTRAAAYENARRRTDVAT
jgi:hypothetical protein